MLLFSLCTLAQSTIGLIIEPSFNIPKFKKSSQSRWVIQELEFNQFTIHFFDKFCLIFRTVPKETILLTAFDINIITKPLN